MRKVAVLSTVWHPLSHTDVIVTRWVRPFITDAAYGWSKPGLCIGSVYLEQTTERDIGRDICRREGIPIFESIESALTLGGDELAVDAVLLIAEHGDYPHNEFRQKLYPRKAFFDEILSVFRNARRGVPVFNDKHLSWDFGHACQMLAAADELKFPLYAGSSLPHCPLDPAPPVAHGEAIVEALALFQGDPENYGFHTLEYLQSFLECRCGGESGIRAVRVLEGGAVRAAVSAGEIPSDLLRAALLRLSYPDSEGLVPFLLERAEGLVAYQLEHRDGLRVTHVLLPKFVSGWIATVRTAVGDVRSCRTKTGGARDFFGNFACLNREIESFFQTGIAPTPISRTHLAGGALQALLQAWKLAPGEWRETPHLSIAY